MEATAESTPNYAASLQTKLKEWFHLSSHADADLFENGEYS